MPFDSTGFAKTEDNALTETLIKLRAVIDTPRKWCKCDRRSVDGSRHCILGALDVVFAVDWSVLVKSLPWGYLVAQHYLDEIVMPHNRAGIANFNDHPGTRHRDVMRLLDKAIENSRNQKGD